MIAKISSISGPFVTHPWECSCMYSRLAVMKGNKSIMPKNQIACPTSRRIGAVLKQLIVKNILKVI
jgi:hypothetical protein